MSTSSTSVVSRRSTPSEKQYASSAPERLIRIEVTRVDDDPHHGHESSRAWPAAWAARIGTHSGATPSTATISDDVPDAHVPAGVLELAGRGSARHSATSRS